MNIYKPWTKQEDELLLSYITDTGRGSGRYAQKAARKLGRTVASVYTRVSDLRLGKVKASSIKTAVQAPSVSESDLDIVIMKLDSALSDLKEYREKEGKKMHGIVKRIVDLFS